MRAAPLLIALAATLAACSGPGEPSNITDNTDTLGTRVPARDTTRPTVQITQPAASEQIAGDLRVTGTAADNTMLAGITVTAGGQSYVASGRTNWSRDIPLSASGPMTITAVAEDTAGNRSAPDSVQVSILPGWRSMPSPFPGMYPSNYTIRTAALGGRDSLLVAFVGYTDPSLATLEQADVFTWNGSLWIKSPFHSNDAASRFDVAVEGSTWAISFVDDGSDVALVASDGLKFRSMGPVSGLLNSYDPSVAFAKGIPWMAYEQSDQLHVHFLEGWTFGFDYNELNGALGRSGGFISTPVLAGTATDWYVAMHEPAGGCTSVRRGQAYAWLGSCMFYSGRTWPEAMVIFNGQPVLLMRDGSPLHVVRWTGLTWTGILTESNTATTVYEVAVTGNRLYLMALRPGTVSPIQVRVWDGTTWTTLAGSVTGSGESVTTVTADIGTYLGRPVVLYRTGGELRVKRYLP